MQRPHSGCLLAGVMLALLSAAPLALAGEAPTADAPATAPVGAPPPGDEAAAAPAAAVTATARVPATLVVERQAGGADVLLDIAIRGFRPPRRGAVEAVVTLSENKAGGREVDVGAFTIFPAKKFRAAKPEDERGFRLDAAQALASLGVDSTAVKVKVRLAPLRDGQSAAGARLTLGKVQFLPRDDTKDGGAKDNPKDGARDNAK